jgi:hypothetical protein
VRARRPDVVVLAQAARHEATDWGALSGALLDAGAGRVVVIGPLPHWKPDLNRLVARAYWPDPPRRIAKGLLRSQFDTNALLKARARNDGRYDLISPLDTLCDADGCLAYLGPDKVDDLMVFDYGHLTPRGSEWLGKALLGPSIGRELQLPPVRAAHGDHSAGDASAFPSVGSTSHTGSERPASRLQARAIQK